MALELLALLWMQAPDLPPLQPTTPGVEVIGPRTGRASAAGATLTVETTPPETIIRPGRPVVATNIRVENRSGRPLAIDYENFSLVLPRGTETGLPETVEETAVFDRPVSQPVPRSVAQVPTAPSASTRSTDVWTGPFSTPTLGQPKELGLQTPDVPEWWVREALPERPLADGRATSGFLFFENVGEAYRRFELRLELVDARTEERLGEVRVPLLGAPTPPP